MPRNDKRQPREPREPRETDDELIHAFAALVDSKGRIDAGALFDRLDQAVWVDGIGDRRTSRALRTALTPAK